MAGGEGRKNTQVISTGVVKVTLDVATRGMEDVGFSMSTAFTGGLGHVAGGSTASHVSKDAADGGATTNKTDS